MTINDHLKTFAGLPVVDFEPGQPFPSPADRAYRISLSWDDSEEGILWTDRLKAYLGHPESAMIKALVVGCWGQVGAGDNSAPVVEALVAARERLPQLRAIFLGDIICEESEISWINQSDVSPLFTAYPNLEVFRVRGSNELSLGRIRHTALRELAVESGGLPASVIRDIAASDLPALEHLELWLGDSCYGWDGTVEDLQEILSGTLFSRLRYLGLRDSEIQDEIAGAVARSPLVERLDVLDLSLGSLSDAGAQALCASPAVARLKALDIHFHYVSREWVARLKALGPQVNAGEAQEADRDGSRYVAVSE